MCGIFSVFNNKKSQEDLSKEFNNSKNRGPEFSTLKSFKDVILGFHRLAINGLDVISNQPIYK